MARQRIDTSGYTSFDQISTRLDEIVVQVRRKDLPLESSLDLFDEAIALGSKAVDFVDTAPVTPEEIARSKAKKGAAYAKASNGDGQKDEDGQGQGR